MKAIGQFAGGISAYDSGKYTRRVMQTNSQNALNAGVSERDRIRGAARMAMGEQLVGQGGSGFQTGTGSALDALRASAINRELDFAVSRQHAGMQAAGFKQQGDMAYAQGKAALAGGILSGVETIAEEVASAYTGGAGGAGGDAGGFGGAAGAGASAAGWGAPAAFGGGFNPAALAAPPSSMPGGW